MGCRYSSGSGRRMPEPGCHGAPRRWGFHRFGWPWTRTSACSAPAAAA